MTHSFNTLEELISILYELENNEQCDFKSDWADEQEKANALSNSTKISMAIGLLSTITTSSNIKIR